MTTYTSAQFGTRILRDLGLIGAEETPSSADLAWAQETANSVIWMLEAKGIALWNGSEDTIPQEYLVPLSARVGLSVAPSFGFSDVASAEVASTRVENNLRILGSRPATGEVAESEHF